MGPTEMRIDPIGESMEEGGAGRRVRSADVVFGADRKLYTEACRLSPVPMHRNMHPLTNYGKTVTTLLLEPFVARVGHQDLLSHYLGEDDSDLRSDPS